MNAKSLWPWLLLALVASLLLAPVATATSAKTVLGAKLYFDKNLSEPDGQACASCHQPFAGYADPDDGLPVSEGVVAGLFGGRNAPSAAYLGMSPVLAQDAAGVWSGGAFWDGRASGWKDGQPLIEQAKGPFLAGVEMNNEAPKDVIDDVRDPRTRGSSRPCTAPKPSPMSTPHTTTSPTRSPCSSLPGW